MTRRVIAVAALIAAFLAGVPITFTAAAAAAAGPPVLAVISTGLDVGHEQFAYGGPLDTTDQIVAWWDFTATVAPLHEPDVGQIWDSAVPDPYDTVGEGTAATSLAAGAGRYGDATPALAPGGQVAVARVCQETVCDGKLSVAIRWAVDTVQADVVLVTPGYSTPFPAELNYVDEAVRYAREHDVLVVAGQSLGSRATPAEGSVGATNSLVNASSALLVGAADDAAWSSGRELVVPAGLSAASTSCAACYAPAAGRTYNPLAGGSSVPGYVAGMALQARAEAQAAGRPADADRIETLLKWSARDTDASPATEGYGILDRPAFDDDVVPHARGGTLPGRPAPDVNAIYVERVAGPAHDAWTETLDEEGLKLLVPTPQPAGSGAGRIAPGSVPGRTEVESYAVALQPGDVFAVALSLAAASEPVPGTNDVDLFVFAGRGPTFTGRDILAKSANGPGADEHVEYRAVAAGWVTVAVVGSVVTGDQDVVLAGRSWPAPSLLSSAPVQMQLQLSDERFYVGTS
ncbi:MAG: hypothetical protein QOG87_914 [Actinomycetota bacterium]|jgi:hypothetical protein